MEIAKRFELKELIDQYVDKSYAFMYESYFPISSYLDVKLH